MTHPRDPDAPDAKVLPFPDQRQEAGKPQEANVGEVIGSFTVREELDDTPDKAPQDETEREQLVDRITNHIAELDIKHGVIKNKDRFGTGLLHGMELLIQIAGNDYEGDMEQFATQSFGPGAGLFKREDEREAQVRDLEALRAINSLTLLQNCMPRVGADTLDDPGTQDLTPQRPTLLPEDELVVVLVGKIAQDCRQLIRSLGPESPQEVKEFVDSLNYHIYEASKVPMIYDASVTPIKTDPEAYSKVIQGDYSGPAWDRFFDLGYDDENPTGSIA